MSSDGFDSEHEEQRAQDIEVRDDVPVEDALEQRQDAEPAEEETVRVEEPDYPDDGVGFDGTPVDQILKDREERLDPENRPENSEVSNAGREFDDKKGMFTDEEGYEEAEEKFDPEAT